MDLIPHSPAPKMSEQNCWEMIYNYRLISYIIKATVNRCKHSQSHDEATNTLLRGSENTESWQPRWSDTLICKSKTNLHNRYDLQNPDKPNDRFIVLLRSKNHH